MATAAQLEALAAASQRADELVHKKINDSQDDVGTRVDLLAEPGLSLAATDIEPRLAIEDGGPAGRAGRLRRRRRHGRAGRHG